MGEDKKATYDELKNYVSQLQQQNKYLAEQFVKNQDERLYKRIDYLFKVIENNNVFGIDFVNKCVEELEAILTIPEEQQATELSKSAE